MPIVLYVVYRYFAKICNHILSRFFDAKNDLFVSFNIFCWTSVLFIGSYLVALYRTYDDVYPAFTLWVDLRVLRLLHVMDSPCSTPVWHVLASWQPIPLPTSFFEPFRGSGNRVSSERQTDWAVKALHVS